MHGLFIHMPTHIHTHTHTHITETFDDPLQAMDFAQAKIHSLVTVAETENKKDDGNSEDDPVTMKFKEVEARFLQQFNMPKQEKLVNCERYLCNN